MFADLLREARVERGMSVAELADRAGTSRSAIADYEASRKQPRFDTALRLMNVLGKTLGAEEIDDRPTVRWRIPERYVRMLEDARSDPSIALERAHEELPEILESDAQLENLGLSWGELKTISDGITVAGAPLQVDRAWALRRDIVHTLTAAARRRPETLRAVGAHVVTADRMLESPARELDFLVRGTVDGADPARLRHLTSAALAASGYPYLWVPFKLVEEYGKGVVAARITGEGTRMLDALTGNVFRWIRPHK